MISKNEFEIFGQYIFLKKLAAGGMAEVYLARPSNRDGNGRVQVVKRVLPHIATHSSFLTMFQQEIRIIMGFNYPHIVQLHEFGYVGVQPFIAMEYIEGKNLKEIMSKFARKKEQIPLPMVLSLMAQAASGLSYAHGFENKVTGEKFHAIHRDISPHNLLTSYDGNLKVIDFGIAKAACCVQDMTQVGVVKGKAAYLAPEQLVNKGVDERTDIFALGVVFWEMLTGRRLFAREGDTEMATMEKVRNCERYIVPPSTYSADLPREVDSIVLRALQKRPDDRFGCAKEMQRLLREIMLRHCPNYSYADVGHTLSAIFSDEIIVERENVRRLNEAVQKHLEDVSEDKTMTTPGSAENTKTGLRNLSVSVENSDAHIMEVRLKQIESLLKQKASTRHYVMLAFYVVSLLGIKYFEFGFNSDPPVKVSSTTSASTASGTSGAPSVSIKSPLVVAAAKSIRSSAATRVKSKRKKF